MREIVTIDGRRDYYSAKECADHTVTVGRLIEILGEYDPDDKIMLNNDDGYTYGRIGSFSIAVEEIDGDDDENEE